MFHIIISLPRMPEQSSDRKLGDPNEYLLDSKLSLLMLASDCLREDTLSEN